VVTQEETSVFWITREHFLEWLATMPVLAHNLARILTRRLRAANAHIRSLATQNVHGRVAHQLLNLAQEYGTPGADGDLVIPVRLTQNDLAGLVGASRVRVNQALVAYKRRGLISIDQNSRITVHDSDGLGELCQ
jgi:CRP/FNR family transcriptional regulator, cyclic AMP receptor protein